MVELSLTLMAGKNVAEIFQSELVTTDSASNKAEESNNCNSHEKFHGDAV